MFKRLATFIFRHQWPIALTMVVITMIMGGAMTRIQIDPSMETLFDKKSHEYLYYRQYNERYGSDQMIAVAMSTKDLFQPANLALLKEVTEKLPQLGGVERVLSLANAMDVQPKFIGVKTVPALSGLAEGERTLADIKRDILSNELFVGNLVSKDGKVANILVYLKPTSGRDVNQSGNFIKSMRIYLAHHENADIKFYIAGSPVEQYDFIRLIRRDQYIFVPLTALLLVVTTFIIYRSFTCMLLSMCIVVMSLIWTMGTIVYTGQQLNLMTSLLGPVIMIVSVINSIYLMNVFFEVREHEASMEKAVVLTIQQLGMPCFLTHFVGILGFVSLAFNPVPAIQSFGIFAAAGTFYSYVVEIIMTPILFSILPYRAVGHSANEDNFFNRVLIGFIERLDLRWKWWILFLTAICIFVSIKGVVRLEVDTNIVKQMKPDLPLAVSTRFIDENVTGVYSLGFVIQRRDGGTMDDYDTLKRLDKFKDFLESKPAISKVNGVTTIIKKINMAKEDNNRNAYEIPKDQGLLKRYLEGVTSSGDPEARKIISSDWRETRMEARMRAVGTKEGAQVEKDARDFLDQEMGPYFTYELTGNVVLLGKMAKGLVNEQISSFGFAFCSILIVIVLMFKSLRLGMLAAIPNLIPIIAVYGIMGFFPIELSTPTAMISSIVLGLVVDASIQFLYRFRLEFEKRHQYLQSLHYTYRGMGHSMFVSTLILVTGFASSVFASFRPTVHFGVLTSLTIFLALLCTLIVLPVCILILKPFGPQRLFRRRRRPAEDLHGHGHSERH